MDFPANFASALASRSRGVLDDLKSRFRSDSWASVITGIGGLRDKSKSATVQAPRLLTDQEVMWLFTGSDLAKKIVEKLPSEAMRLRWETGLEALDAGLSRLRVFDRFLDSWIWGRAYGRGALFLAFADRLGPYIDPVKDRDVREGDLLYVESIEGIDLAPSRYRYGIPTHYTIARLNGKEGGYEIHASRFVLFGGPRTPNRVKRQRSGADISVLQPLLDILRDADQSWRGVMLLMADLSQAVFKIKGLVGMIANGQKDVILDRMEIVDLARSIARAVVIDADGESFEHVGAANVSGIGDLLTQIFQRVAGAADLPMTVLFGISPAGMNATGESDRRLFQASAAVAREDVTPQAERISRIVARSMGLDATEVCVEWPDLWEMTDAERATIELQKAQTAQARITAGVTDADEERAMWVSGKSPADVIDLTPVPEGLAEKPAEESSSVLPGSIWIDTEDGHRLEVTKAADGRVYFIDRDHLDETKRNRQYAWAVRSFLERARLAPPEEAAPAPAAPAAPPAALPTPAAP